jgi:hypothetical protein
VRSSRSHARERQRTWTTETKTETGACLCCRNRTACKECQGASAGRLPLATRWSSSSALLVVGVPALLAKIANLVSGVAVLVQVGVDLKGVNWRRGYVPPCWYPQLNGGVRSREVGLVERRRGEQGVLRSPRLTNSGSLEAPEDLDSTHDEVVQVWPHPLAWCAPRRRMPECDWSAAVGLGSSSHSRLDRTSRRQPPDDQLN